MLTKLGANIFSNIFSRLRRLSKPQAYFLLLVVAATIVALTIEMSDDEAYYWSWALVPDFSYFDHPPLQAWITSLSMLVFGKTNLAVRLPALVGLVASGGLLARWAGRISARKNSALWIFASAPIYFAFSWMALPDVFFLPLALAVVECVERQKFFYAGLALGFAMLAKWHAALLVPGVCVAVILGSGNSVRNSLKNLCLVALPALLLQSPVVYWNYAHNWVSFKFHLLERHSSHPDSIVQVIKNGGAFAAGFLGIAGLAFTYLVLKFFSGRPLRNRYDRHDLRLLAWGLPFLGIFGLSALNGETRIYWTSFAIFPLFLFVWRHALPRVLETFERVARICAVAFTIALFITLYLPIGAYCRPVIELFRDYDLRHSPRGDFIGWAPWADEQLARVGPDTRRVLFLAADYRMASQMLWNSRLTLDQVYTVDNYHQYSIWRAPNPRDFTTAIFFGDNRRGLEMDTYQTLCQHKLDWSDVHEVKLLGRTVKIITDTTCTRLDQQRYAAIFKSNLREPTLLEKPSGIR